MGQRNGSLGWHGVCASDHFWVTHSYPHVFVAATEMACNTEKLKLTTSFCNNLFRSPVEFCQAAFSLQQASSGRFEAGLGAGWLEEELVAAGLEYPQPKERITRYIEAPKNLKGNSRRNKMSLTANSIKSLWREPLTLRFMVHRPSLAQPAGREPSRKLVLWSTELK